MAGEKEKSDIEGALVDAELFLKYRMPERALSTLREAVAQYPTNTDLRWNLAELCVDQHMPQTATEELIALAKLYTESNQPDFARSALLKARQITPNIPQIDAWLAALDQQQKKQEPVLRQQTRSQVALSGDLQYISLFDVIQAVEKNQVTGVIYVQSGKVTGSIYFNKGLIADAVIGTLHGKAAFKCFAEVNEGIFELEKSPVEFQSSIGTSSNAQLILEVFAEEESEEPAGS